MLFHTWTFGLFFLIVFGLYLRLSHTQQNRMLLLASYIFYGSWDARFLVLVLLSTVIDYGCGIGIHEAQSRKARRGFLVLSVAGNLTILGFFKYWNFFSDSLQGLLAYAGIPYTAATLNFILPVGISFYTFQTMSYTIDIYRGELRPTRQFADFALFVAFFPQLVAGPIERARRLLPQILAPRRLTAAMFEEGFFLILWGLFEKIYVADNLAGIADVFFNPERGGHGMGVLLGTYAFAFQIFCDFDGYSNIARGLARCLGFDILVNFRLPYFATNPGEFWRRWHISFSTWLRDYVYIPLGGNQQGPLRAMRNVMVTMLLGGLWHGASWTFVLWGAYHGMLILAYRALRPLAGWVRAVPARFIGRGWAVVQAIVFFHLVCIGWILFRAESVSHAGVLLGRLFLDLHLIDAVHLDLVWGKFLGGAGIVLLVQWWQWSEKDLLAVLKYPFLSRWCFYTLLFHMVCAAASVSREYIYFQF